jgi:hypothetical protein
VDSIVTALTDGLAALAGAITAPIPFLASSGILLIVFAGLWIAFAAALVRDPARIDTAWRRVRALPLVVQGLAWLLFLPVLAGAWAWRTGWPVAARLAVVGGLAGWSLLVLLPGPA